MQSPDRRGPCLQSHTGHERVPVYSHLQGMRGSLFTVTGQLRTVVERVSTRGEVQRKLSFHILPSLLFGQFMCSSS